MYQYYLDSITKQVYLCGIKRTTDNVFIPFDPANTDYQTFKKQINEGTAQLEDADGNLMTDAKDFVATLP